MTKGVLSGGRVTSFRLWRITSSQSQALRRRLVRTTDDGRHGVLDACRCPSRLYFSHFATRTVDNTVDLYAAKPDIRSESRFFPTPPAFDAPFRGVHRSRRNIAIPFGMEKLEWLGYTMVKNFEDIFIRFGTIHEHDGRTDGQTDTASDIGRAYASHRAAKICIYAKQCQSLVR